MSDTQPFLAIYAVWHPASVLGAEIAGDLYDHYRRNPVTDIDGGAGLSVQDRSSPFPPTPVPRPIDFQEAATTAIVVVVDEHLLGDPAWRAYVLDLAKRTLADGLRTRLFLVSIAADAFGLGPPADDFNFMRWHTWPDDPPGRRRATLIFQLTYELSRMLRRLLASLEHPASNADDLDQYLKPVRVFLSHSKHDTGKVGETIALGIRNFLQADTDLASFFDVQNIPPGLPFAQVLNYYVRISAIVAIHTESYSSREWCRREILEAKRVNVPLVVANCITDREERSFPYMGNVPVVRMEPQASQRIIVVIGRLLDEVMKDFLWRCRVASAKSRTTVAGFLPRPPELVSIAELMRNGTASGIVVYPDPPLGMEELELFAAVAGKLNLRSYTQWLADGGG